MIRNLYTYSIIISLLCLNVYCSNVKENEMSFTGAKHEVKLITIDPGHFHAALIQKIMYEQVSPIVHVYAPEGSDVTDHLNRIDGFNNRPGNPTKWVEKVYTGPDYFDKMIEDKPGNVLVTSGNNQKKIDYINAAVEARINVLADKPMCINIDGFYQLQEAFKTADKYGVLLYDIMTERGEITTFLQKELIHIPEVFGQLMSGTTENPSVVKESVHHFSKLVAGNQIKRPAWFFDVSKQGEGIVDVTTHLIDLVQWECFPEQIIYYQNDIKINKTNRWPTLLTPAQFEKVTHLTEFPGYLSSNINDGVLSVYSNGEINYTIKGINAKVKVEWKYQAPEDGGDTHFSIIRGSKSNIIIRQGKEQNYRPELYVEPTESSNVETLSKELKIAINKLQKKYPGISLNNNQGLLQIYIPDEFRIGHEAHFGQVTERFLQYLIDGKLPDWEVPNMITKYYISTKALEIAKENFN